MKKFTLLLSAMLFSVMSFAGLGTGYTKVTNISTLSAGDKVVLYCDDAELGITGWDGNKTGTAGASGWVEYVVEAADGGVLLKDGTQYISLTVKNTFKYNATGSVCKVTADGILCITLDGADYMLYENANNGSPLYRMYVDKTGNAQYKPFYVYEVTGEGGETPVFNGFEPLPHWDLAKKYDLIDFEMGVKIAGAGFPIYKGKGARLQRALINFFLDEAREAGYLEVEPPYVVNEASGYGTGQLPDKEGQMYHATADNLYLIPTAEVPVTNIFRDVILSEKELPQKMCAYSACFRREAGSYGKDVVP